MSPVQTATSSPWALYDSLLQEVPETPVEQVVVGQHWLVVRAGELCGMSMNYWEQPLDPAWAQAWQGKPLSSLARELKSWNFGQAALGLAALNAACNQPDRLHTLWQDAAFAEDRDAFTAEQEAMRGKKVAVIGGFPGLPGKDHCELSVLERRPQEGQFPDSACEYILPEQDLIFATGTTLINKTLPRLVQLKGQARFSLVGPSAPLHPLLYAQGVDVLAGVVVDNAPQLILSVQGGACHQVFGHGVTRVNLPKELLRHA